MNETLFILLLVMMAIAAFFFIPAYMTNRAMVTVVRIFRAHRALDARSAKTVVELGIGPRQFMDRLQDPRRDYKPVALSTLITYGIVRQTADEKLYLNERSLTDICHHTENRLKVCSLG